MGLAARLLLPLLLLLLLGSAAADDAYPDDAPYDLLLWPATHNSAIGLGRHTVGRPSDAVMGAYDVGSHLDYQYIVMDQRLSVRDQLEQGVRVLDFEVAALTGTDWVCEDDDGPSNTPAGDKCVEEVHITKGRCFRDCPFVVSHGSLQQSIGDFLGYSYPEDLFSQVAAFVEANPREIVTLVLIQTHGNRAPQLADITSRLRAAGLLERVYNSNFSDPHQRMPTLGEMRAANRTILLVFNGYIAWPGYAGSLMSAAGFQGSETCANSMPCTEGWDSVTFENLDPTRAIVPNGTIGSNAKLFMVENLSSRRGRANRSFSYTKLPNELADFPFQAGGNPAQASLAANYSHIIALEAAFAKLLSDHGLRPNWMLVDFFNTTNPGAPTKSSRSLRPNPDEGLIRACADVNRGRVRAYRESLAASARFAAQVAPTEPVHPTPPRQSTQQMEQFAAAEKIAAAAAEAALPELVAFIERDDVQSALEECCASFVPADVRADGERLWGALRAELLVTELVHNFPAVSNMTSSFVSDVNLSIASNAAIFYNGWELEYLGLVNNSGGDRSPEDKAETGFFGCREFTGPKFTPASWSQATDRLIYTAVNSRRIDLGNPGFGTVSVVFDRTYFSDAVLVAPTDTGIYEMMCNWTGPPPLARARGRHRHLPLMELHKANCSAYGGNPPNVPAGTLNHMAHLILPSIFFWNSSFRAALGSPADRFAAFAQRLLAPYDDMPVSSAEDVMQYLEANIAGNAVYPDGIHFIVADFASLFGTDAGTQLQLWCERNQWILAWAFGYGNISSGHRYPNSTFNKRALDPVVLGATSVLNLTSVITRGVRGDFQSLWDIVESNRSAAPPSAASYAEWWSRLHPALRLHPITSASCSASHRCVGTLAPPSGDCVCYAQ